MATWADQPKSIDSATNGGSLNGSIEVIITGTVDDPIVITNTGSPGCAVTRSDTGTYNLAFPTGTDKYVHVTYHIEKSTTLLYIRPVALDVAAGTAQFETFNNDAGTAILADPGTLDRLVVRFRVLTLGPGV